MSNFLSGLGARLGIGGHGGGKLPAGNSEWAQLANFFPDDGTGTKKGKDGQHVDVESILGALGSLGGGGQPPPAAPPPDWMPMPQPRMLGELQNAPRLGQRQMMGPPQQMAPYMWGGR